MANSNILLLSFLVIFLSRLNFLEAQLVPAVFIFGDSITDVGNNNYLKNTFAKANFTPNGIDFPGMIPTGRFCNGKNVADFVAERVGLPSSPPYLSLVSRPGKINNATSFLTGANFASAAAGILNSTGFIFGEVIPLWTQIDYFATVSEELKQQLGPSAAQKLFAKSIFMMAIGNNDVMFSTLALLADPSIKNKTPQQRMDLILATLEEQLRRLYDYGARKFLVIGASAVGCCPFLRAWEKGGECNEVVNSLSIMYNEGVTPMLRKLKSEIKDMSYTYYDSYGVLQNLIQNAKHYGFDEFKAACCGQGNYRGIPTCFQISPRCSNRSDHLFWDPFHPTEAAQRILIDIFFDGPSKYTFPFSVHQLIAL
ncbi:hypothetical protein I3843_11G186500 [Carya illinoinensis]|uniref:GDSL esterase/lipase At5g55050-like n=1 Tax=Carya illinoinensis TaxID=32201 RepID=A0A8T1P750_CARIL|nr:GDSL esterase/lipase At5g55050-like [Carya illinoinensis]KAG6637621.1 hypothetical protein CIPAW_11G191500 [Carya illinoinensis]KAG6689702.1 hypothetical protein I3842_11G188600 [Carya illinoinensis]KAG7957647.1 hypothetical protein I3843_11G186500 [Carya illinoinensis]